MHFSTLLAVANLLVLQFLFCGSVRALRINLVSDLHYDPYYRTTNGLRCTASTDPPFGKSSCDAPKKLIDSLLTDLSTQRLAYTLVMGDLQRHSFDPASMSLNDTIGYLSTQFANVPSTGTLEGKSSIFAMGNNDFIPNYSLNITSPGANFEHVVNLFNNSVLSSNEAEVFKKCAFYTRVISPRIRVIVLNTLIWTYRLWPPVPAADVDDPCSQLAYLRTQLADARLTGSKVIIVSHIPPYPDVWKALDVLTYDAVEYWKDTYQNAYTSMIKEYKDIISLQLFGHTHLFSFQAFVDGVPSYVIPAISPIYGNIPSYMVAELSEVDWSLQSMRQRYLNTTDDTPVWVDGIKLEDILGDLNNITTLRETAARFTTDDKLWDLYVEVHGGGVKKETLFPKDNCDAWCRTAISCSMRYESVKDISDCTKGSHPSRKNVNKIAIIVPVIFGVLVITGIAALVIHCLRVRHKKAALQNAAQYEVISNEEVEIEGEGLPADAEVSAEVAPHGTKVVPS